MPYSWGAMVKLSALSASEVRHQVELDGFAIVPACLDEGTVELLCEQFGDARSPERNLLSIPSIRRLARSPAVREVMEAVLEPGCFAVRGTLFNKTGGANWKIAWHQDLTIAVRERRNVDGLAARGESRWARQA
jgi:hypothetical protein